MGQVKDQSAAPGDSGIKVLHLLCGGPEARADRVVALHSQANQVTVIDLSRGSVSYADLIDEIFAHDRVICW